MDNIKNLAGGILSAYASYSGPQLFTVALSGIDASGSIALLKRESSALSGEMSKSSTGIV